MCIRDRWGMKQGAIDVVSISDAVPAEVKKLAEDKKAEIRDGKFNVWTGPLTDNTGKQVLAKDTTGDDKFVASIMFFVKGVEGKIPSGK